VARFGGKFRDGAGGMSDCVGMESMRFVKAVPEPGLDTFLAERNNFRAVDIGHKQFHRIGADIDDGAARRRHAGH